MSPSNPTHIRGKVIRYTVKVPPIYHRLERIWDDNDRRKKNEKPCCHYKVEFDPYSSYGYTPWITRSTNDIGNWAGNCPNLVFASQFSDYMSIGMGTYKLFDETNRRDFVPPPADLMNLIDASLRTMLPKTPKADLSIVNSILELKDLRSLPQTLLKLKGLAQWLNHAVGFRTIAKLKHTKGLYKNSAVAKKVRASFSTDAGHTLREVSHAAADTNLQWQFGIRPLIQDICGVYAAVMAAWKRMKTLADIGEGRNVKHYNKWFFPRELMGAIPPTTNTGAAFGQWDEYQCLNPYLGTGSCVYGSCSTNYWLNRRWVVAPAKFHAKVVYNYHLDDYERTHARWLTMLDRLGWNLNPSIVWNAIPFSFMVDWFFDVSRLLDDLAITNMSPKTNILDYSWSWKTRRVIKSKLIPYSTPPSDCPSPMVVRLPDVVETAYRRDPSPVWRQSQFVTGGLSLNKISLAASIGILRWKPRRRA